MRAPVQVIEPSRGWYRINWGELWRRRELLFFFLWRDFKVRYKQTLVGVSWAIIQPLALMGLFTIFFGLLARIPSDGVPYPIFAFTAILPWRFFANALSRSTTSIVSNSSLIKKISFPRIYIPLASVLSGILDFACALVILFIMMRYFGISPSVRMLYIPGLALLTLIISLGIGLWLTALNAQFRDIGQGIPIVLQAWLYASPVAYPASLVPENLQTLYGLNPMVGVIEGFRWATLQTGTDPSFFVFQSLAVGMVLLISGLIAFRQIERTFADVI